jgi:hypothetical protein
MGGPPDPALPLTLDARAYMSTEQVTDMAKQWGIKPIVPVDDSD